MATGQSRVNIYLKKFLPQQQMVENFLDYLRSVTLDVMADMFPLEGFFYGGLLSGDGSDKFKVSTPCLSTDGIGHRLLLDPSEAEALQFENALGSEYFVGLRYNEIPQGTEVNVRDGKIQYTYIEERIGELGQPNSIIDGGATITLVVDSVTEAGVSNHGRKVRAWLKQAIGQADAFYEGTVIWDGAKNTLITTHLFGQNAGAISTDPADYQVFLIGPTVKKNTDLDADPNVAFIGTVTGAGSGNQPSTFDQTGQNRLTTTSAVGSVNNEVKSFLAGGGLITWDLGSQTLTWAEDILVKFPHQSFSFNVVAGSQASLADGDCLYIHLDTIGGAKPFIKVPTGSVPNDPDAYTVVMRIGNNVYFKNGALELKGDAGGTTGGRISDITQDLLDYIGATDESDGDPNYPSADDANTIVTQGTSLTSAVSELNNELIAIATNNPGEEVFVIGAGGASVFTLTKFQVDPDNTVYDIECYIDGRRMLLDPTGGLTKGFRKVSLNQVETSETVPEGKEVVFWKQGTAYGGPAEPSSGSLWSDPMDSSAVPNVDAAHDVGTSSRRIREANVKTLYANTMVERSPIGDLKRLKSMVSGHPSQMLKGIPIAKGTDGKMYPADSDASPGKKYCGILLEDVEFGNSAIVLLPGINVPNILTGLGFQPGQDIFLNETAGTYIADTTTLTNFDDDLIRVGIADCSEGVAATMATDLIMVTDVVARA